MSARSVSNLSIVISANTAQASAALEALAGKAEKTKGRIDRASGLVGGAVGSLLGGRLGGVGGFVGGLLGGPAGAAIGALGGSAVDAGLGAIAGAVKLGASLLTDAVKEIVNIGAEYEMALTVFSNAVGSDQIGRSLVSQMQGLATATVFSSKALLEQGRRLLGAGVAADNIIPTMTKLALVAQRTGMGDEGLQRLVYAFTQIKSAGRLTGMELRQLNEVGVGTKQLADALGMSSDAFTSMVTSGQMSFSLLSQAMNTLGTQAQKEADKVNKTFTGRLNSVKDLGLQAFGEIGLGIIKAFKLPQALSYLASFFQDLPKRAAALAPMLEGLREVFMPIGRGLYAGLSVIFEAGSAMASVLVPSMKDMVSYAKSFGELLAVGVGKAIDMAIVLGKKIVSMMMPMAFMFDATLGKATGGPSMVGMLTKGMAGLVNAENKGGPGGYGLRALNAFRAGFPETRPFDASFNQGGIDGGPAGLPAAVKELAQSIKENFASGKIGGPVRDFQTNMANLRLAEGAGLLDNRAAADQFILNQFKSLTDSFKSTASALPRAIDMNTVAGQEQFERVIMNLSDSNKDVPTILRDILRVNNEQVKKGEETVKELRKFLNMQPVPVGGF